MNLDPRATKISLLAITLQVHQKALGDRAEKIALYLKLHTVRHQAFYAAARVIADKHQLPSTIDEKVRNGGRYGDEEAHHAGQRALRARETISSIADALAAVHCDPHGEQILHDMQCLDSIAQHECRRADAALDKLKARIDYLEKWALNLTIDSQPAPSGHVTHH